MKNKIIKGIITLLILGALAFGIYTFTIHAPTAPFYFMEEGKSYTFVADDLFPGRDLKELEIGYYFIRNPDENYYGKEAQQAVLNIDAVDRVYIIGSAANIPGLPQPSYISHPVREYTREGLWLAISPVDENLRILERFSCNEQGCKHYDSDAKSYTIGITPPKISSSSEEMVLVVYSCAVDYSYIDAGFTKIIYSDHLKCQADAWKVRIYKGCNSCTDPELCLLNYVKENKKNDFLKLVFDNGASICREEYTACMETEECEQLGVKKSLDFRNDGVYVNKEVYHCEKGKVDDKILKFVNDNNKQGVPVFGTCVPGAKSHDDCVVAFGNPEDFYIKIIPTGGSHYQQMSGWGIKDGKCILGECRDDDNCELLYGGQGWICRQTTFDAGREIGICDRYCESHIDCANRMKSPEDGFVYGCFNNKCMRANESKVNLVVEGRYICEAYEQAGKISKLREGYAWYIDNDGSCKQYKLYTDQCQTDEDCTKRCVPGEKSTCYYSKVHKAKICTPCTEVHFDPTDHCSDGILNYDEEGIDCGGEDCPPCEFIRPTPTTTISIQDEIEDILPAGLNVWIILGILSAITGLGLLIKALRR